MLVHLPNRPVLERVLAVDASPWGKGVAQGRPPSELVRDALRWSERWRFGKTGAGESFRSTALEEYLGGTLMSEIDDPCTYRIDKPIPSVPAKRDAQGRLRLMDCEWSVCHSRSWQYREHITALEARAFVWASRHVLRPRRSMGARYLLLSDPQNKQSTDQTRP